MASDFSACTPMRRGQPVDEARPLEVHEGLVDAAQDHAVAHGDHHGVGGLEAQLGPDLQAGGLLALDGERMVGGVAVEAAALRR